MTKDKERDDAMIAEVVETLRDVRDGVGCQPGYINTLGLRRIDAMLAKLQPAPKPDRAEVLYDELSAASAERGWLDCDAVTTITRRHFAELRAEWEAERPAVVVPFGDDVIAAARFYADVLVAGSRIAIMANAILDGAKGNE